MCVKSAPLSLIYRLASGVTVYGGGGRRGREAQSGCSVCKGVDRIGVLYSRLLSSTSSGSTVCRAWMHPPFLRICPSSVPVAVPLPPSCSNPPSAAARQLNEELRELLTSREGGVIDDGETSISGAASRFMRLCFMRPPHHHRQILLNAIDVRMQPWDCLWGWWLQKQRQRQRGKPRGRETKI